MNHNEKIKIKTAVEATYITAKASFLEIRNKGKGTFDVKDVKILMSISRILTAYHPEYSLCRPNIGEEFDFWTMSRTSDSVATGKVVEIV